MAPILKKKQKLTGDLIYISTIIIVYEANLTKIIIPYAQKTGTVNFVMAAVIHFAVNVFCCILLSFYGTNPIIPTSCMIMNYGTPIRKEM